MQRIARRPKPAHFGSRLALRPTSTIDPSEPPCPALGNFYLSSCPGKKGAAHVTDAFGLGFTDNLTMKVRLTGPVRGRGAIYRDLKQDLRRIKALGIGCIVWCAKIGYYF